MAEGLKAGELYLELGVKKETEMLKALVNVNKGLGKIAHAGLGAKATVAGLFAGMGYMMNKSLDWGNNLYRFSSLIGRNNIQIQKWGYLAQQAGGHIQDMQQAFVGVQNLQSNIALGNPQAVQEIGLIIQELQNAGVKVNTQKLWSHPMYFMRKMVEFAKMTNNSPMAGIANMLMQRAGISVAAIEDWRNSAFNLNHLNSAFALSSGDQKVLNRGHAEWANVMLKVDYAFERFTVRDAPELIKTMSLLSNVFIVLMGAVGKFFSNPLVGKILMATANGVKDLSNGDLGGWLGSKWGKIAYHLDSASRDVSNRLLSNEIVKRANDPNYWGVNQKPTVTQNNHFHGIYDHKELGKHIEAGTNKALDAHIKKSVQKLHQSLPYGNRT